MSAYTLGSTDPVLTPDPGAGRWGSKPKELISIAEKAAIIDVLPGAYVVIGDDAVKHMSHYLGNTGGDYTIDLQGMVDDVPSAKTLFNRELEEAKRFVETRPVGLHDICSTKLAIGYNLPSESSNWYYAIGGYSVWGKGTASVSVVNGTARSYRLILQYKFYDRYNWDGGKSVTILGKKITDETMGELHLEGLAQEFNCYGSFATTVTWGASLPVPAPVGPVTPPPPLPPKPSPGPKPPLPHPTPPSPVTPSPKVYVVKPGDNLSKISRVFYGNAGLWTKIYNANKSLIGPNPNLIHPGQSLFIP
jgi:LysM repeat protein